jgi:hypothetical protein
MLQPEDVLPVRSRLSWSSIFAGAAVALAVYVLFSVLGLAMGLSLSQSVSDRGLGIGAAVWAVLTMLLAFFLGGYVTTQCAVGENRSDAFVHGVVLWATLFAVLLWLSASGLRLGVGAMVNIASNPAVAQAAADEARRQGVGVQDVREQARDTAAQVRELAADPRATQAAWWSFLGILLSMLTAIWGALAGSGPSMVFRNVVRRTTIVAGRSVPTAG